MKSFIREKKIYCGTKYMEVDIYGYSETERSRGKRSRKEKISAPSQRNLNDKNARRYFTQLAEGNFGRGDLHVTLTYSDEFLPGSIEEAEKEAQNYLRRIKRRRVKEEVGDLKYILVTAYRSVDEEGEEKPVRVHHHILMNGGLDRDIIEDVWRKRRRKGEKEGRAIGYVNADRIQPNEQTGIAALCTYLVKNPSSKRRWTSSQNLTRPVSRTNDHRYSRKRLLQIVNEPFDGSFWEKIYPGWRIADPDYGYEQVYNEFTGWGVYLKLRKIE